MNGWVVRPALASARVALLLYQKRRALRRRLGAPPLKCTNPAPDRRPRRRPRAALLRARDRAAGSLRAQRAALLELGAGQALAEEVDQAVEALVALAAGVDLRAAAAQLAADLVGGGPQAVDVLRVQAPGGQYILAGALAHAAVGLDLPLRNGQGALEALRARVAAAG